MLPALFRATQDWRLGSGGNLSFAEIIREFKTAHIFPVFQTGQVGQATVKPGLASRDSLRSSLARTWLGRAQL